MRHIICIGLSVLWLFANTSELEKIDDYIKNNPWFVRYKNYSQYNITHNEIKSLESELAALRASTPSALEKIDELEKRYYTLKRQEELLSDYKDEPYKDLVNSQYTMEIPTITNPFLITSGFSYIKNINSQIHLVEENFNNLEALLDKLHQKAPILSTMPDSAKELQELNETIEELDTAKNILSVYVDIFKKNAANNIEKVHASMKDEGMKLLHIVLAIAIISLLSFAIKMLLKFYAQRRDSDKSYVVNKFINVLNITIIVCILLFTYIENVTYIITIIGFVSAGLAIAMKDWFMSFFGYMVIMGGGSIKIGDRIRVVKDNAIYVGDVIDVSMLRITLYEDVTYTTYKENRRAGRIIFIPNNLIFTTMIANYSHSHMKTVWDGIDITITFESNYKKALQIASTIAKKYSSGYTETTRRQLNNLKVKYSLRDMNVEPRVFSFIVPNGIRISIWFQTNAYASLMLNSIISSELIEEFNKAEDITISYPTTRVISSQPHLGDGSNDVNDSISHNAQDSHAQGGIP